MLCITKDPCKVIPKDQPTKKLVETKANQFQNLDEIIAFKTKGISGYIQYVDFFVIGYIKLIYDYNFRVNGPPFEGPNISQFKNLKILIFTYKSWLAARKNIGSLDLDGHRSHNTWGEIHSLIGSIVKGNKNENKILN